jgi:hypothetical protein
VRSWKNASRAPWGIDLREEIAAFDISFWSNSQPHSGAFMGMFYFEYLLLIIPSMTRRPTILSRSLGHAHFN